MHIIMNTFLVYTTDFKKSWNYDKLVSAIHFKAFVFKEFVGMFSVGDRSKICRKFRKSYA